MNEMGTLKKKVTMCMCVCVCVYVLVTQSCPTLCNPMDYLPGSSVHGISQAKILDNYVYPVLNNLLFSC